MSRIKEVLRALKEKNEGAFLPFVVIGDPDERTSFDLSLALISTGADVLEFGFPFSDPPADGPTIQAADVRALKAGMNTEKAFTFLAKLREKTEVPFALLIYYNLILAYGIERFYKRCEEVGVDAVLVADLSLEEASEHVALCKKHGVAPIFIVSELTSEERLQRILKNAEAYLYLVGHLGVTGTRAHLSPALSETIQRIRKSSELPILAGFGIGAPDQARATLSAGADGIIVGSALVAQIERNLGDPKSMLNSVQSLAASLKRATVHGR